MQFCETVPHGHDEHTPIGEQKKEAVCVSVKRTKMKRRRLLSDDEENDEEEEEDSDRRNSLRRSKRFRHYTEYSDGDDDEDGEEEEEEEEDLEDQEDNEQPGPSTQNTHNQRAQEKRLLLVTCGDKKGTLDVEKLARGEECIQSEGSWFSPPAFEDFAGKGSSKKWKVSIFHEGKPLQILFDPKKILSPHRLSESSSEASEIQSTEETEEDDVQDDDWLPGSEELALEAEGGERAGPENGGDVVDSGDDKNKEEEDKTEMGETEDEEVPAVTVNANDNNVFEEMKTRLIISTSGKTVLRPSVVVLRRLGEAKSDRQSTCTEHSEEDSWCKPMEDTQSEEESQHNGSAIDDLYDTTATQTDTCQMSDVPAIVCFKKERDERNERKDGQTEIQRENSPGPLSAAATSSNPDTHTENHITSSVTGDMRDIWEEKEDEVLETERCEKTERERKKEEHLDMSSSEASVQPSATVNIRDATSNTATTQWSIKDKSTETMSHSSKPQSVHIDATTCGSDAAKLRTMVQETRDPQTTQASDTHYSDMEEGPSSKRSASINLDTVDLDQLKREKIKMQLKILKLQAEYYTLKIQEFKK
ncbi:myb-like protein X isoform X2 [Trachinotus anak]|uniref:myb-like protein X isoform X2 n=1 Tax=Trachinotus anak TaxID=443729 RepID=UPI0039F1A21C